VLKIPTTNVHVLSAERVAKVTKKLIERLVQKGVLPPPAQATPRQSASAKAPGDEGRRRTVCLSGLLLARQRRRAAFRLVKGDKPEAGPSDNKPNPKKG
jgi:hypothetical protein